MDNGRPHALFDKEVDRLHEQTVGLDSSIQRMRDLVAANWGAMDSVRSEIASLNHSIDPIDDEVCSARPLSLKLLVTSNLK